MSGRDGRIIIIDDVKEISAALLVALAVEARERVIEVQPNAGILGHVDRGGSTTGAEAAVDALAKRGVDITMTLCAPEPLPEIYLPTTDHQFPFWQKRKKGKWKKYT